MAFEVEEKNHKQTHRLLTGISTFLERYQSSIQSRMTLMAEPSLLPTKVNRQTIDSRDKFMTRLYQILVNSNEEREDRVQLFLKFTTLVESAEKLTNHLTSLRSSLVSSKNSRDDTLALLESSLRSCEEMLYSGSATKGGAPQLSHVDISQSIAKLNQFLDQLEETLLDIISNINSKKKTLQANKLLARERSLFVYFFTEPAKLRRLLTELSARLEAKKMS
ncbi:HAUS augmin-like complex subunit 3 [Ptychodera flava]|uniref:HAUS augmin-like complex subunit 3 n=1 Tax=Ptychodera flava TaxID=63121 RepID=UPI003969FC61